MISWLLILYLIAAMKAALTPYVTAEGIVLDSSSWKITARNPN
jgi:hypothetical protein